MAPKPFALAALGGALLFASAAGAQEAKVAVDLGGGTKLELVLVQAGAFQQGSPPAEPGRADDEAPRTVRISRPFYVGKTAVTRGQFARFATETGYRTEAEKGTSGGNGWDGSGDLVQRKDFTWRSRGFAQTDDHPVVLVTFDDAVAFTRWASGKAGRDVALPTEAQYEYAERAGTRTRFYAGDADGVADVVGWSKRTAGNGTRPVGQKKPNDWGLYDMAGGSWSWCRDWYAPYAAGPITDPEQTKPTTSDTNDKPRRVLRGGSWLKDPRNLRSAARYRATPGSRNADFGLRVVASVDLGTSALPPATPSPATPLPATPARGTPSDATAVGLGLGCFATVGLFFAALAIGAVLLLRRRSGGVAFRVAADGFWIVAPARLHGETLWWRCQADGSIRRGSVVLQPSPSGTFVYTGATPRAMEVEHVGTSPPAPPAQRPRRYETGPSPFRGYPGAY